MNLVEGNSVHVIVTSPPYWQLKDYGTEDQIGYHENYENYINNLNLVWKECYRVLENGCRLCINIGDQFARAAYYGRYKVISIRTEIVKFCETIGFDYMGAIIWQKQTTTNTTGGASLMGSFPTPRNGILSIDYEYILIFKKPGVPTINIDKTVKEHSRLTTKEWRTYFSGHWNLPGVRQDSHLAMFPLELPTRLIKMFSFKGEMVLDPFLGSGTTSLAARNLDRNSIGYEINAEFIQLAKQKLNIAEGPETNYEFLKDVACIDIEKEFENLSYRFVDFQNLDKKVDPKKMTFGSKIDKDSGQREEYYSVKEIISPKLIKLGNGLMVRLLGVKVIEGANEPARKYLEDKTKGQKVYLRFDREMYDEQNNLMCYLYLKDKTFLNARLIKDGFAEPDQERDFKYKKKFIALSNSFQG